MTAQSPTAEATPPVAPGPRLGSAAPSPRLGGAAPSPRLGGALLQAIAGLLRFLVRLLLVLIVGVLIGLGLYYGVPWAYRSLVLPVQQNTVRVAALDQRMVQEQARLQDENLALQGRIAALEAELTALKEQSAVQAQQIEGSAGEIEQLDGRLAQVEEDLVAGQEAVRSLRSELETDVAGLSQQADRSAARAAELEGRLALLQTAQGLLKVHLLLLEGNPRSARDTLALAAAHLGRVAALMPEQGPRLAALQERMVGLEQLIAESTARPESSFRVGPELESLWAEVMDLVALPAGEQTP